MVRLTGGGTGVGGTGVVSPGKGEGAGGDGANAKGTVSMSSRLRPSKSWAK